MAKSKVTFPDGTIVEIPADASPEQITAILRTLQGAMPPVESTTSSGKVVEPELSAKEIWEEGSKKEKLAIFVRNHFLPSQWFSTIKVRDEQLEFVKRFVFGESPAIATYLNRLHDDGYLHKSKSGSKVKYQLTDKIIDEYPELELQEIVQLMNQDY